ncbi:MAG: hypothetical protein VW236_07515, partial [Flavobacteriaceae bacterium]
MLAKLEQSETREEQSKRFATPSTDVQLSFVQLDDLVLLEIRDELADLDIDHLTPVEALMKLQEIKNRLAKL